MEKLLFVLIIFFCKTSFGQFARVHHSSDAKTLEQFDGGFSASGGTIISRFSDTSTANGFQIKNYGGAQIITHDTVWIRNLTHTKWLPQVGVSQYFNPNDALIYIQSITLSGNIVTLHHDIVWRINGTNHTRITDTSFTIAAALDGQSRKDIIYADSLGVIHLLQGTSTTGYAVAPALPTSTILITTVDIYGSTPSIGGIEIISAPYVDTLFKPTSDSIAYTIQGRRHALLSGGSGSGSNFANADLTFTGARTHDAAGNKLQIDNLDTFSIKGANGGTGEAAWNNNTTFYHNVDYWGYGHNVDAVDVGQHLGDTLTVDMDIDGSEADYPFYWDAVNEIYKNDSVLAGTVFTPYGYYLTIYPSITSINNVPYRFPNSQNKGGLLNNGNGNLSWDIAALNILHGNNTATGNYTQDMIGMQLKFTNTGKFSLGGNPTTENILWDSTKGMRYVIGATFFGNPARYDDIVPEHQFSRTFYGDEINSDSLLINFHRVAAADTSIYFAGYYGLYFYRLTDTDSTDGLIFPPYSYTIQTENVPININGVAYKFPKFHSNKTQSLLTDYDGWGTLSWASPNAIFKGSNLLNSGTIVSDHVLFFDPTDSLLKYGEGSNIAHSALRAGGDYIQDWRNHKLEFNNIDTFAIDGYPGFGSNFNAWDVSQTFGIPHMDYSGGSNVSDVFLFSMVYGLTPTIGDSLLFKFHHAGGGPDSTRFMYCTSVSGFRSIWSVLPVIDPTDEVVPLGFYPVMSLPSIVALNHIPYIFPIVQGDTNSVLTNDGTGKLSWTTLSGGGIPVHNDLTSQTTVGTVVQTFYPASDGTFEVGGYLTYRGGNTNTLGLRVYYANEIGAAETGQIVIGDGPGRPFTIRVQAGATILVETYVVAVVGGNVSSFDAGAYIKKLY